MSKILKEAKFKKNQKFIDLGSGDGRVVLEAIKQYSVNGTGIDINPVLIFFSRLSAKLKGINQAHFKVDSVLTTKLKDYDVIYFFLMPKLIQQFLPRLRTETKKNVLIISHGFKIPQWEKYNFKIIKEDPFYSYFYKLN